MKRASYRQAVAWVANNDSAADDGALSPTVVQELVTVGLVADLFGVDDARVAQDVVKYRTNHEE